MRKEHAMSGNTFMHNPFLPAWQASSLRTSYPCCPRLAGKS